MFLPKNINKKIVLFFALFALFIFFPFQKTTGNTQRSTPVQVKGVGGVGNLTNVAGISAGSIHTCAYTTDGSAYCWGYNGYGQLGDDSLTLRSAPVQVKGVGGVGNLTNVAGISTNFYITCAWTTDGKAYCWGYNGYTQLGDGSMTQRNTPIQVKGVGDVGNLTNVAGISVGSNHTCAYTTDGSAYCWGYNGTGQLGDNSFGQRSTPVQVKGVGGVGNLTNVAGISAGSSFTCAHTSLGAAYCWGSSGLYQLGNGTNATKSVPTPVSNLTTNTAGIFASSYHACAWTTDGSAYCWGNNSNGRLGTGDTASKSIPTLVQGGLINVARISSISQHTCALTTNNTVYCWGDNIYGQLGDGTFNQSLTPVQVKNNNTILACTATVGSHTYPGDQTCNSSTCQLSSCATTLKCGDTATGTLNGNETCDNGTSLNGSSCSANYNDTCEYCSNSCDMLTVQGPYCGDLLFTPIAETCDGPNIGSFTCANIGQGFNGGTLLCNPDCNGFETSLCYKCGDGWVDIGETCDGTALNGQSCATQGFTSGTLTCNATCSGYNTASCYRCGDGNINPGESCDGANLNGKTCTTQGFNRGALSCSACAFNTSQCFTCGDGVISALETCDQGSNNVANGDGCNSNCQIETGYSCSGTPSVCAPTCGNSILNAGEACDPGNTSATKTSACVDAANYNGVKTCSSNCLGYDACVPSESCGDSTKNGNELCDTSANNCTINNYQGTQNCTMTGANKCQGYDACNPTESCGDGIVNGPEGIPFSGGCDDGNASTPGCSSTCHTESGYACTNTPGTKSVCEKTCSNGTVEQASGEICDPNDTGTGGTATATCTDAAGYPGTQTCKDTCTGYDACVSTLYCGDSWGELSSGFPPTSILHPPTITNPPEVCDKTTQPCTTPEAAGGYAGTEDCSNDCKSFDGICDTEEKCGDHILNGNEECDYDETNTNYDGCSSDCKVEEGFFCSGINPNTCVFSCGNEVIEADKNEQCDEGTEGKINSGTNKQTTAPYNGDVCVVSAYGATCDWCDKSCKTQTMRGDFCGDGKVDQPDEACDDGNSDPNDGCTACENPNSCTQGCKVVYGFVCKGLFSTCATQCGDGVCAAGAETCINCPGDCRLCSIGQRPGVADTHNKGVFTSFFDKIKTFIVRPQPVIQIPGLNLGQTKSNQEFIPPPPPTTRDYKIGEPTFVKIGDEYYTITVQTIGADKSVSFTIK